MADKPLTRVITGKVRLSYVHVFEPWSAKEDQTKRYSCAILIPKADKATIAKIKKAVEVAAEEGKSKVFGGRIPRDLKSTLHDGDEEADLDRNPEYAGHWYMSISSKTRPGVVDSRLDPIIDSTEVYSGCFARVSMNAFAYSQQGNKGVSFGLNNIMKVDDGPMLGGGSRAEDDFAEYAEGENLI